MKVDGVVNAEPIQTDHTGSACISSLRISHKYQLRRTGIEDQKGYNW